MGMRIGLIKSLSILMNVELASCLILAQLLQQVREYNFLETVITLRFG